jgi:hypothetical protein
MTEGHEAGTERELERVEDVPPQPERPLRPVGWLLAPELLAQLRTILHRRRNDPRDWMPVAPGHAHVEDGAPDAGRVRDIRITAVGGGPEEDAAEGDAPRPRVVPPEQGELWFDYIADTGDGGAAMFTMAYLLQAELRLDERATDRDRTDGAAVMATPRTTSRIRRRSRRACGRRSRGRRARSRSAAPCSCRAGACTACRGITTGTTTSTGSARSSGAICPARSRGRA